MYPNDAAYGKYLNWLCRNDATLTFPQTLVLRYTRLEPEERRLPQVVEDYSIWYLSRLKAVENQFSGIFQVVQYPGHWFAVQALHSISNSAYGATCSAAKAFALIRRITPYRSNHRPSPDYS